MKSIPTLSAARLTATAVAAGLLLLGHRPAVSVIPE